MRARSDWLQREGERRKKNYTEGERMRAGSEKEERALWLV